MTKKKNFPLIIGFSIPILMILFIAVSIYLPGLFLQPKFNFLYSTDGVYYGSQMYSVTNGHLVQLPQQTPAYPDYPPSLSAQLYVHNVRTNESTPISFQDAQNLNLNPTAESPDGFKLENGNQGDGFFPFFWYNRDYADEYLVGHNVSKKLNIETNSTNYDNSIHFLGWIMQ